MWLLTMEARPDLMYSPAMAQSQTWWFLVQQNMHASGRGPKWKKEVAVPVLAAGADGVGAGAVVGVLHGCDVGGCGAAG